MVLGGLHKGYTDSPWMENVIAASGPLLPASTRSAPRETCCQTSLCNFRISSGLCCDPGHHHTGPARKTPDHFDGRVSRAIPYQLASDYWLRLQGRKGKKRRRPLTVQSKDLTEGLYQAKTAMSIWNGQCITHAGSILLNYKHTLSVHVDGWLVLLLIAAIAQQWCDCMRDSIVSIQLGGKK